MESESTLQTLPDRGWRNGLGNLFSKEFARWLGQSTWWKNLLRWTLLINGIYAMVSMAVGTQSQDGVPASVFKTMLFFMLGAMITTIGLIIAYQGSIIGERQLGTAAWILSKPVSRPAFILSKFTGGAAGFLTLVLAQAVLGYLNTAYWTGHALPPLAYAAAIGLWLLSLLFYLALVLMLGAMLGSRGGVIGIALAVLMVGQNMSGLTLFQYVGPFRLMDAATSLAIGQPLAAGFASQVLTTALATIIMIGLAVRRFQTQDL